MAVSSATREQILRAARVTVEEQGGNALSMRKLAADCGISATAIYRHFQNKDALLAELVVESFRVFASYLAESARGRTALSRFRRLAQRYFDFSQECPHDYRLIFMTDGEILGFDRLDESQVAEVSATFEALVLRLKDCMDAGVFRAGEPRLVAASVWAAFHGLASLLLTGSLGVSDAEAQKIASYQLRQLERSLVADVSVELSACTLRVRARPQVRPDAQCRASRSSIQRKGGAHG